LAEVLVEPVYLLAEVLAEPVYLLQADSTAWEYLSRVGWMALV
jgi:hypothetical protein